MNELFLIMRRSFLVFRLLRANVGIFFVESAIEYSFKDRPNWVKEAEGRHKSIVDSVVHGIDVLKVWRDVTVVCDCLYANVSLTHFVHVTPLTC